jgi:hypothetical protein
MFDPAGAGRCLFKISKTDEELRVSMEFPQLILLLGEQGNFFSCTFLFFFFFSKTVLEDNICLRYFYKLNLHQNLTDL